jgi:hypothetical protein
VLLVFAFADSKMAAAAEFVSGHALRPADGLASMTVVTACSTMNLSCRYAEPGPGRGRSRVPAKPTERAPRIAASRRCGALAGRLG